MAAVFIQDFKLVIQEHKVTLSEQIRNVYPELTDNDFRIDSGKILLCNDGDGQGDYIAKWEYSKPIPEGLKLGK